MRRKGLLRPRPKDPPSLLTCIALSAILVACLIQFLIVFAIVFGGLPFAEQLLLVLYVGCPTAVLVWRFHRYGVNPSKKPFLNFSLLHLVLIVVAVGVVGGILSFRGVLDTYPALSMVAMLLLALLGCAYASTVTSVAQRRGWPTRLVNQLIASMAFVILPTMGLGVSLLPENPGVGILLLLGVLALAWAGWGVACWSLENEKDVLPTRRVRPRRKIRPPAKSVARKAQSRVYRPNRSRVHMPRNGQYLRWRKLTDVY